MASRLLKSLSPRHRSKASKDNITHLDEEEEEEVDAFALSLVLPCAGKAITDTMPEFKVRYPLATTSSRQSETEDTSQNVA